MDLPKPKATNRRKYQRVSTDHVISFAPVEARDLLGVSRDVSAGGIRFEAVGCEMHLGDVLRVTFNIGDQTVNAVGRVCWAVDLDPITTDVGIEFIEVDPEVTQLLEEYGSPDNLV
jgi:c-di-GMP-binding flagellar brake protein YcgR